MTFSSILKPPEKALYLLFWRSMNRKNITLFLMGFALALTACDKPTMRGTPPGDRPITSSGSIPAAIDTNQKVGSKPEADQIQSLNELMTKMLQNEILNVWLVKSPDQPEAPVAADLAPTLAASFAAIKSQCEIKLPKSTQEAETAVTVSNNEKVEIAKSNRSQIKISSTIEGANCPLYSFYLAEGTLKTSRFIINTQFNYTLKISKNTTDAAIAKESGISKDIFEGSLSITQRNNSKYVITNGNGNLALADGTLISYSMTEQKLEERTSLKINRREVRRDYNIAGTVVTLIATYGNTQVGTEVRINGNRVGADEAPAMHKLTNLIGLL
jgi:hypothetical protein